MFRVAHLPAVFLLQSFYVGGESFCPDVIIIPPFPLIHPKKKKKSCVCNKRRKKSKEMHLYGRGVLQNAFLKKTNSDIIKTQTF